MWVLAFVCLTIIVNRKIHYKYYKGENPFIIPQSKKLKTERQKLLREKKTFLSGAVPLIVIKNLIWIYLFLLLIVFLSNLHNKS